MVGRSDTLSVKPLSHFRFNIGFADVIEASVSRRGAYRNASRSCYTNYTSRRANRRMHHNTTVLLVRRPTSN